MELHLKIVGCILVLISFIHVIFPKYFNWEVELLPLSVINKQLMYVHTFFIALIVFLMGVFCLVCSSDIVNTKLGGRLAFGLFVFWGIRLVFQFFVYSAELWKGKTFETVIHVIFSFMWTYFTVIFFMIWYLSY
jgi:hypothetical protein